MVHVRRAVSYTGIVITGIAVIAVVALITGIAVIAVVALAIELALRHLQQALVPWYGKES
ncbi:hypothetical protein UA45_16185 [Morganella morganii]|uniref:Uncharacterized protein n=1 Tax=Morganella morganii TaxID=582 RepID=A0A0D8L570_MORMO|nr:hypothetical protein UA45_16185 [Morganella morganii]